MENIDKTTKNKAVRLNLKINTLEKNLARINEQLELIQLLNLDEDKVKKAQLERFKSYLELQISKLKSERQKFGVLYCIQGFFGEKIDISKFKNSCIKTFSTLKNKILKFLMLKNNNSFLKSTHKW